MEAVGVAQSYRADRRLVSQNVDVQEVKAFLAQAESTVEKKETPPSLEGGWSFTVAVTNGKKGAGKAEFRDDGTFALTPTEGGKASRKGRYACANGVLWLMCDEGQVCAKLSWENKDRFKARGSAANLVFERHKLLVEFIVAEELLLDLQLFGFRQVAEQVTPQHGFVVELFVHVFGLLSGARGLCDEPAAGRRSSRVTPHRIFVSPPNAKLAKVFHSAAARRH